jgi:hypothetical protein
MGISPQYQRSACNFWTLFDNNPQLVGATIRLIAKSLGTGSVIQHVRLEITGQNLFHFLMQAVAADRDAFATLILNNELQTVTPEAQDSKLEINYSKNADFTDEITASFLKRVDDLTEYD